MTWHDHWVRATSWLVSAGLFTVTANAVEALADPDGTLWGTFRMVLSSLFLVAFAYWLLALVQRRIRRLA
jgi:hypothetical protein